MDPVAEVEAVVRALVAALRADPPAYSDVARLRDECWKLLTAGANGYAVGPAYAGADAATRLRLVRLYRILEGGMPKDIVDAEELAGVLTAADDPRLGEGEEQVLRTLARGRTRRLPVEIIAAETKGSVTTVKGLVNTLIVKGYADRNEGQRKGAAITTAGRAALDRLDRSVS
jgi:hypothetical protein